MIAARPQRVCLLFPKFNEGFVMGKVPLGLSYLAGALMQAGIEVTGHNLNCDDEDTIDWTHWDWYGMTLLTPLVPEVNRLAAKIRAKNPHARIVCGGTHATLSTAMSFKQIPDLDYIVAWPKDLTPGDDGLIRHTVNVRQVFFPPELTAHVWKAMRMRYVGAGNTVVIGLGAVEGFEDAPLELDTVKRGITVGFSGHMPGSWVATDQAHTGTKSLRVKGTLWPTIPQVVLQPNTRYRLEAWMKVAAATEADLAALRKAFDDGVAKAKADHEKKVAAAVKKGQTPPEWKEPVWVDPKPATGFISANTYEWSPHNAQADGSWAAKQQTSEAAIGDWQKVELEFDVPAWGPFVDIRFHATGGGTAWVDDFLLAPVPAAK